MYPDPNNECFISFPQTVQNYTLFPSLFVGFRWNKLFCRCEVLAEYIYIAYLMFVFVFVIVFVL